MPSNPLQLDIVIPALTYCALLWWVGRGMSWTRRLITAVITLALVAWIVIAERGWH